ncbi:Mu transposase C-terminal domain-containing protein, partial [Methylomonas koyamae]|uniref:Mu transposase C-terminal domain-containing protein n=1 Tax=Methylomonas koyamae TaxID=702114 RepID=UPI000B01BC26
EFCAGPKYYHLRPHEGMDDDIPLHRYQQGLQSLIAANKTIPIPRDPRTFLIDFLPVVRRSLQRDGITIDHITYYSNALRPWIQLRNQPTPLLIRRDPRDLSRIFVLDEEHNVYLEVPYRMLSRPAISLWEHKLARKRLREQRRTAVDEASLFAAIDEMREIERKAETLTRTARRNRTRRQLGSKLERESSQIENTTSTVDIGPVRPFDDIEAW